MTIVPIQLNDGDLQKIDYLIEIGRYKNRSQALRAFIETRLNLEMMPSEWESHEEDHLRKQIVQSLTLKKKKFQAIWHSDKSAVDAIREDRDQ